MSMLLGGTAAAILEAMPDAIVVTDAEGIVVFVNTALEAMFGYQRADCVGRTIELLVPEHLHGGHAQARRSYAAQPRRRSMTSGSDLFGRHRDGTEISIDIRLSPLETDGQRVLIAAIRDVSERRAAAEALRRSEARLRAAVQNLPFPFWAYDADGSCTMQNNRCVEAWGDHVGERLEDIGLPDDLLARWQETRRRALAGEVVHQEERLDAGPELRGVHTIAAPIVSGEHVTGVLGINIDVTEERKAQELQVELRAAQESERLKDALLGTVSHELRTPISVIRGYATLAAEYGERLTQNEMVGYFRDIDRYAVQLDRLVDDLLTMSRLEAGALSMNLRPVDMGLIVNATIDAFRIAGRQRDFIVSAEAVQVVADAGRIEQVLSNLIDNADKYSDPCASIEVSVRREGANRVAVSVRDYGPGVATDELDAIFERFHRVAGSPGRGTGLGLAICRSIIEAHDGSIRATVPPGGGLEVTLSIPVLDEAVSRGAC